MVFRSLSYHLCLLSVRASLREIILPVCVTPFVQRQKTDANDAEAIAGAALRPTMRYVSVKSAAQQAQAAGIVRDVITGKI